MQDGAKARIAGVVDDRHCRADGGTDRGDDIANESLLGGVRESTGHIHTGAHIVLITFAHARGYLFLRQVVDLATGLTGHRIRPVEDVLLLPPQLLSGVAEPFEFPLALACQTHLDLHCVV
jgi:hypothetical protein